MALPSFATVPTEVVKQDDERFDDACIGHVAQYAGIVGFPEEIRRYCHWYVGAPSAWKVRVVDDWTAGFGIGWATELGNHLGDHARQTMHRRSLHMLTKAGRRNDRPFYWTRLLTLDWDRRANQRTTPQERVSRAIEAFGPPSVVHTSPSGGLHTSWVLSQPVSIFGFLFGGDHGKNAVVPMLLDRIDLPVQPGTVEVLPTHRHCLRLPLGPGTRQLDPTTLMPLAALTPGEEVARLAATLDNPTGGLLDPYRLRSALLQRVRYPPAKRNVRTRSPTALSVAPFVERTPANGVADAMRLERDGLYEGLGRNEAALALARLWRQRGLDDAAIVNALMEWTETKTNGLSKEALEIHSARVANRLRNEYARIVRGLAPARQVGPAGSTTAGGKRSLGAGDATLIFRAGDVAFAPATRYAGEVFTTCFVGLAKDCGRVQADVVAPPGLVSVRVEAASKTMDQWPRSGHGFYREWLSALQAAGIVTLVREYRHSANPALARARAYAINTDTRDDAMVIDRAVLCRVARAIPDRRAVHPRQLEHALLARERWSAAGLDGRYGRRSARWIRTLCDAYDGGVALTSADVIDATEEPEVMVG